jgi:hypothetical protein
VGASGQQEIGGAARSAGLRPVREVNGLYHGYMYIDLILALAVLAFLVMRAGFDQLPFRLPVGPEQALVPLIRSRTGR